MTDLSTTIDPKSDQLNSEQLISGPITITVTGVKLLSEAEQPIAIHYEGESGRPFKPCKTVRRILVLCWGGDGNNYIGRQMTLYRDPDVKFGGLSVGGIRVSHLSHLDGKKTLVLSESKAKKRPYIVEPMKSAPKSAPPTDALETWAADVRARIEAASEWSARPGLTAWWNAPAQKKIREPLKGAEEYAAVFREFTAHIDGLRAAEEAAAITDGEVEG